MLETCRQHCCELRLAPAYDIVNTTAYIPQDVLALDVVGNKTLFASRQGLLEFAQVCDVARPTEVIREQLQALERVLVRSTELSEQALHVSRQSGNVPFRLCRRLASALGKISELTTLENAVRGDGQPLEGTRGGTDQKA